MAKGVKTGGRVEGVPNKATQQAREAIAAFVDGNAHRLQEWLDAIATGSLDGKPNPVKAFELFQSVIEYHVPKLQRSMIGADPENPIDLAPKVYISSEVLKQTDA